MSIKKKNDIYIQKKQKEEENIKNYNLKINKSNEVKEQEFNKLNNDIGKLTKNIKQLKETLTHLEDKFQEKKKVYDDLKKKKQQLQEQYIKIIKDYKNRK